jgi:ABC-type multidrug transport system permease subunit
MSVLLRLFVLHLKKFFRQPAILFWAVGFPVIMAWVLGAAFSKPDNPIVPVGILSSGSTALMVLPNIHWVPTTEATLRRDLRLGSFSLYVSPLEDNFVAHYDPKNQAAKMAYLTLEKSLSDLRGGSGLRVEPIARQGSRYIDFLLPGLAALSIMNSALWGLGFGTIEMRMKKMLRRMVATPMSKVSFLGSLILSRLVVGMFELLILFGFCKFYFNISFLGSLGAFFLVFVAGTIAFCGFGILVASRTSSTAIANGLINLVTLPMMVLSGIFFSYRQFPSWAVSVIEYLPLTQLADAFRLLMNEPVGVAHIGFTVLLLLVTGVVTSAIGLKLFRWH